MATYTWRNSSGGAGGAFDVPSNWSNPSESISTTVPSAADTAVLSAGGGPLSGSGSVTTLAFSNAAWSITGQIGGGTVTVDNGTVTAGVNGGQLLASSTLQVGLNTTAVVAASNGGEVVVSGSASGPAGQFGSASLSVSNRGLASFGSGLWLGVAGRSTTALVDAGLLTVGGVLQIGGGTTAGSSSLTVIDGGETILSAATDTSTPYLKVGAVDGASGSLAIDGANSLLLLSNNSGAVGFRGTGSMVVSGGAQARFNASSNTSNNALNPALTIGRFGTGTVTVSGTNSLIAAGGSIIVGTFGSGTLTVQYGAAVTAVGFTPTQAALAVASAPGGTGNVTITGSGSSLTASGAVIVGGDDRGSGQVSGGAGSVSVLNGGLLQAGGTTTVLSGSNVGVDGSSTAVIGGNLAVSGSVYSAGTLVVGGAVFGGGQVTIGGGVADLGSLGAAGLAAASITFGSASATVRLHGVVGANSVLSMQTGDEIDLVGNTSVRLIGTTVTTTTGSIALSAAPTGSHYEVDADGAGGTAIVLTADTIGVYRFFDSNYGTHFFSASTTERNNIIASRPDLVYEGVGLQSVDPASGDSNAANVYRFFDSNYGTHFFTASASERDTVIRTRPDLLYEGTGFLEHTTQQAGDTAVYRFFDANYGTHFYTADANERATVIATRPDLIDEGIGFYAPPS